MCYHVLGYVWGHVAGHVKDSGGMDSFPGGEMHSHRIHGWDRSLVRSMNVWFLLGKLIGPRP